MKTTNGKYILSMNLELSPEQIAAILENQADIIEDEIGTHEVIAHLRNFVDENVIGLANRLVKMYETSDMTLTDTLARVNPLLKERKKK